MIALLMVGHELLHRHPAVVILVHLAKDFLPSCTSPRITVMPLSSSWTVPAGLSLRAGFRLLRLRRLSPLRIIIPAARFLADLPPVAIASPCPLAPVFGTQDAIHVPVEKHEDHFGVGGCLRSEERRVGTEGRLS